MAVSGSAPDLRSSGTGTRRAEAPESCETRPRCAGRVAREDLVAAAEAPGPALRACAHASAGAMSTPMAAAPTTIRVLADMVFLQFEVAVAQ